MVSAAVDAAPPSDMSGHEDRRDALDELMEAAHVQDLRGITRALRRGADVNAHDERGKDALYYVARRIQVGRVNRCGAYLLSRGADLKGRCRACIIGIGQHTRSFECEF